MLRVDRELDQSLPGRVALPEGPLTGAGLVAELQRGPVLGHHDEVGADAVGALPVDVGAVCGDVGVTGDVLLVDAGLVPAVPPGVHEHGDGEVGDVQR